jgi:hypothetical protein
MREIPIGDNRVRVRATPLALLFYKQEFKTDLIADILKMGIRVVGKKGLNIKGGASLENLDFSALDSTLFLQLVWAMAKADSPKGFPSFMTWVEGLERIDFADAEFLNGVIEEAVDGFFRGGRKPGPG